MLKFSPPPLLFRPSCVIKSIVPACSTLEPFCINVPRSGGGDFSLAKVQGALCSGKNWLSFKKMRRGGGVVFPVHSLPPFLFLSSPLLSVLVLVILIQFFNLFLTCLFFFAQFSLLKDTCFFSSFKSFPFFLN